MVSTFTVIANANVFNRFIYIDIAGLLLVFGLKKFGKWVVGIFSKLNLVTKKSQTVNPVITDDKGPMNFILFRQVSVIDNCCF